MVGRASEELEQPDVHRAESKVGVGADLMGGTVGTTDGGAGDTGRLGIISTKNSINVLMVVMWAAVATVPGLFFPQCSAILT